MHTQESIQALLESNDKAVIRGLLAIYARQTSAEQSMEATKEDNGIGFNACDAPFMSSLAKWYNAKGFLTPKQLYRARKTIIKYRRQLTEIANEKLSKALHNEDLEMKRQAVEYEAAQERKAFSNYGDFA